MTGVVRWPLAERGLAPIMALMESGFPPDYGERWSVGQLSDLLTADPASWLLVDRGDGPDGFALGRIAADQAELMLLAVRPAARRHGVARSLLRGVAHEARKRRATTLFAEVRVGNDAELFYAAQGFRVVGRRPRYYRRTDGTAHDALTMQLILNETTADD